MPSATPSGFDPPVEHGLVVRVLGSLQVLADGREVDVRGGLRRRLLLALIAARGRPVSVDALAVALWGDRPTAGAANAVQAHVSRLRRLLDAVGSGGIRWLVSHPDGYVLQPDWLDLAAFEAAVHEARTVAVTDPRAALTMLGSALALPASPVHDAFTQWDDLVRGYAHRRAGAEDAWADLAAQIGGRAEADRILDLARAEPLREVRWILAMRALTRAGRQAEALAAYDEARTTLAEEFGLDPGRDLQLTQAAVLRQDPELLTPPVLASAGAAVPRPVTSFVGRGPELARLGRLAAAGRLVTTVGMGGVGKSRLLTEWILQSGRAGLSRWVDLRGAAPGEVVDRVARELGLAPQESGAGETVASVLATTGTVFLVLDNADPLGDEVAAEAMRLLTSVPQLTILVTSREPLGVSGERVLVLAPFDLADPRGRSDAESLAAARIDPDAPLEEVRRVVEGAGGVPLAIELLAANPAAADGVRGSLAIRELVVAAVDALPEDTARLFAAFVHLPIGAPPSLTADLAARLARSPARAGRLLRELVAASLLVTLPERTPTGSLSVRHRMLQPVGQAAEWSAAEDASETFGVLAAWASARTRATLFDPPGREVVELQPETPSFEAALAYWRSADPERGLRLTIALRDLWHRLGLQPRAKQWLRAGLADPDLDPLLRAEALLNLSFSGGLAGVAASLPTIESSIALLKAEGVRSGPLYAAAHGQRAVARGWRGDLVGFDSDIAIARSCAEAAGSPWMLAMLDQAVALSCARRLRPGAGVQLAIDSAHRMLAFGDVDGAVTGLYWASLLARFARDDRLDAILAEASQLGAEASPPTAALVAGEVARRELARGGPTDAAVAALVRAINWGERSGVLRTAASRRSDLGRVLLEQGRRAAAESQLRRAADQLLDLDTGEAALAVAALAALADGPQRAELAAAAWGLALGTGGTPPTRADLRRLRSWVGRRPQQLLPVPDAVALARTHVRRSETRIAL